MQIFLQKKIYFPKLVANIVSYWCVVAIKLQINIRFSTGLIYKVNEQSMICYVSD